MVSAASIRSRFPGANDGWARFDGPAGTQAVDVAIEAVAEWMRSGRNAAAGGYFAAAQACTSLLEQARSTVGMLLGAPGDWVSFGPNMTSLTLAVTRAVAGTLRPGERVVGTQLDHDANVTPWRLACAQAGAEHVLAPFDPASGRLDPASVVALIDEHTRWVTLPGASNLIGTVPDHRPIIDAARRVGARVYVDAVAWAPHQCIDVAALGCDALVCSPYKWYGPHAGVLVMRPEVLASLPIAKVAASAGVGPARIETGMPSFEAIAGVDAAARFLLEEGMDRVEAAEREVFAPLLDGLASIPGVRLHGPSGLEGRTPTVAFTVAGSTPAEVARALAADRIAVWDGHNYALEVVERLGLSAAGGVVRAGVVRYTDHDEVARLLSSVARIAARR